jgi:hypothetical protein
LRDGRRRRETIGGVIEGGRSHAALPEAGITAVAMVAAPLSENGRSGIR